ncbi:L-type lectin-domain containing receptor kinase IX.1-like [Salvia hispanica]|uniref:L-type lectin-domain containing receptor kinase IX.1-like n=1 Tax=Salvia hispanica TaxID=49212 RepID=UPI00200905C9|nr:L-type lectin-domain containing receptor kinase IX.1-like [Salvia hispanica]
MAPYCSISIYLLLLITTSTASPLSFNLPAITTDETNLQIMIKGDAYISTEGLQVTNNEKSSDGIELTGRATYADPLHLWDKATGNLTDFDTHFSFVIQAYNPHVCAADGLAFFLAPFDSPIPPNSSGSGLGLGSCYAPANASEFPFVAVEFDTFSNDCDPPLVGQHVGIDVRSLNSTVYAPWGSNLTEGDVTDVWISYNSSNMKFRVNFTDVVQDSQPYYSSVEYTIDLRNILPEFVAVGFSAATGDCFQTNNVKSWSFSSTLDVEDTASNVTGPDPEPAGKPVGLIAGLSTAVAVGLISGLSMAAAVGLVLVGCWLWRRKRRGRKILAMGMNFEKGSGPRRINYGELAAARGNFAEERKLGEGGDVLALEMDFEKGSGPRRSNYRELAAARGNFAEESKLGEGGDVSAIEMDFEKGSGPRRFSYRELAAATGNFAEERKLGEGGFGGVYRGFLKNLDVAVKRVSKTSKQGKKEYASEVTIISRLRHRNLVQLIGWCHERCELLVVYELQPKGSLDSHLFKKKYPPLNWETRFKIARGLAAALLYLHEEWEQCVLHRDIKSSNVMLDSTFNAKLGDFGLARLVDHDKALQTTILAGTIGYIAPECLTTGRASKESDVYGFGIVALEISTGRQPISEQVSTVGWVWELYGTGRPLEAADVRLEECGGYDEREMERLMAVGLWCAHPVDRLRPSMKEVVRVLAFEGVLPPLPSKMPAPAYGYSRGSTATSSSGASVSASSSLLFSR